MVNTAGNNLSCSCCKLLTSADKAVQELHRTKAVLYFALCAVLFLAFGYLVLIMRGGPLSVLPPIAREAVRIGSLGFICAAFIGLMYCIKPFEWPPKAVGMRQRHWRAEARRSV
jgi:hypothetical protein